MATIQPDRPPQTNSRLPRAGRALKKMAHGFLESFLPCVMIRPMQTLDAIFTRRSIRTFRADPIPETVFQQILKAGMASPSAMDEQPWHFVVLPCGDARGVMDAIQPQSPMAQTAPAAILVCCDMSLVRLPDFWVQDCSAASQNILLAAHDLGLGAVWVGIHPMPDRMQLLRERLGLPEGVVPFALIPLGYPGEILPPRDTFKPERVHSRSWS